MATFTENLKLPRLPQWLTVNSSNVETFDRTYIILAFAMYIIGLVMVASSSMPVAERMFGNPFHFIIRHSIYIGLSLIVAGIVMQIPLAVWHKHSTNLLIFGIILLVAVLIIGRTVNGSQRWIM